MTALTFRGRLPGVVCQTALPPSGEEAIRLDVAAFVGFAERGPLHTPVAVEDSGQYAALFGGDLQVARDGGKPVYAHLPSAVRDFFDNGGRRCYVVRVAGEGARPNRFRIPGLIAWTSGGGLRAVVADAAWVGRWSDTMRVGAELHARPLAFQDAIVADDTAGTLSVSVEVPANVSLVAGDLLRIQLDDPRRRSLLFPIAAVQRAGGAPSTLRGVPMLATARQDHVQLLAALPPAVALAPVAVERLAEAGWEPVADDTVALELAFDAATATHHLSLPADRGVAVLDLLRVTLATGEHLLLPVEATTLQPAPAEPPGVYAAQVSSRSAAWLSSLTDAPAVTDAPPSQIDLLTFDLHVGEGDETLEVWRERRFNARPGFWADALAVGNEIAGNRSLRLAAPGEALAAAPPLYLPLAMPAALTADGFLGPLPDTDPAGKDGLDLFDPAALFLDPRLRDAGTRDLVNEGEFILWQNGVAGTLAGLHSLLPVEEVALLAVPDLVHRGWPVFTAPPAPPELPPLPAPEPVDWTRFRDCPPEPVAAELSPAEVVARFYHAFQSIGDDAAAEYLTTALRDLLAATTLAALLDVDRRPDSFAVDGPACHPAGVLSVTVLGTLHFTGSADVPHRFTLIFDGSEWRIDRIEALTAWTPQSDSLRALAALPAVEDPVAYDVDRLLDMQRALITLCAARFDMVAVLALPEHFEKRDVLDWQTRIGAIGALQEGNALSYAAVYHPWQQEREPVTPELALLRTIPPQGAICGLIAARELTRGVWEAPVNAPLLGTVGLSDAIGEADWVELFDAHVNLLHQEPGRFVPFSAHTLSPDRQLLQVSVRRLLIYLRKLALRRGQRYVFEPNDERFRRRVEAAFERTLRGLLNQGALTAFQVVTGEGLNTPNDVENGRFLIALKVAPSVPIEFITVALLRSGEGLLQVLEV